MSDVTGWRAHKRLVGDYDRVVWIIENGKGEHIATMSRSPYHNNALQFDYHRHDMWGLDIATVKRLIEEQGQ